MKSEELVGDFGEQRLVAQELAREAVHGDRFRMDVALGVDVAVELAAGGDAVDDLDAADLDQPVTAQRIEARRLGVENDLAQHRLPPANARTSVSTCDGRHHAQCLA